jgi:predicted permease
LKTLVKLNLYLFVPAFILVRLSTSDLSAGEGLAIAGFTLAVIAGMGVLSWLVCLATGRSAPERYAMKLSTMIYNCGNWGIPLMALAFPASGGVVQVFVLATMNLTSFSLGVVLASAGGARRGRWLLAVLKQPSPWAILLALALRATGHPLREVAFVWLPLEQLAAGLVAFALVTLGVQLSQTKPPPVRGSLGYALSIRLLGGPLLALGLTWALGFRGEIAAILILGAAAPTAVNTALLAHEFEADSRFAAAAVFYSTLLASIVVAVLLAVLRSGWIPWAVP